jgi:hypothetical protein
MACVYTIKLVRAHAVKRAGWRANISSTARRSLKMFFLTTQLQHPPAFDKPPHPLHDQRPLDLITTKPQKLETSLRIAMFSTMLTTLFVVGLAVGLAAAAPIFDKTNDLTPRQQANPWCFDCGYAVNTVRIPQHHNDPTGHY